MNLTVRSVIAVGGIAFLAAPVAVRGAGDGRTRTWVSGYYTAWNKDLYPPDKVDFSALTHIIVGRVLPRPDGSVHAGFDHQDGAVGRAMARTLSQRAHAAGRKALIMVGGSGEHAGWVGAASPANRPRLVGYLLAVMDETGFDGLDIDWEPVERVDRGDLLALARELRAARPGMILTFPIHAVNMNKVREDADPWFAKLAESFDQVNVMSYEMAFNAPGWISWFSSPLFGEAPNHPMSVSASLKAWAGAGIPKSKLGMGIPFYGVAWRNISGPYQPYTGWSDYIESDNALTYRRVMQRFQKGSYHWDEAAQSSYLTFSPPVDGCRWISYDSPQAIAAKAAWLRANGYGGTIIWTLNQGCTDPSTGANPPLDAVKKSFLE